MLSLVVFNFSILRVISFYFRSSKEKGFINICFRLIFILVGASFLVSNPFLFLILLEFSVMPTTYVILLLSKDKDKNFSVILILIINLIGSVPFIFCSLIISAESLLTTGCFMRPVSSVVMTLRFIFILRSKIPVSILHFWLTKAHVAARACASIILASILLKLGTFGLVKFRKIFSKYLIPLCTALESWCLLFCIFFSLIMVRFTDIKMLVACSSILHIGLILPFLCHEDSAGVLSIVVIITRHGVVSFYLFYLVRIMYEMTHRRSIDYNKSNESFNSVFSMQVFLFVVFNLGVPPLANLISEVYICFRLIDYSYLSSLIFSTSVVIGIIFRIFMLTKNLFGRKLVKVHHETERSLLSFRFMTTLILLTMILSL